MIVFQSTISKFEVLTPCGKVTISQKWVKLSKLVFQLPMLVERQKSKVKENWYFEVKYSFMKPLSQNFEVLTQSNLVNVINPKLARKRTQTRISCTNVDRKIKIKNKRNSEVQYSFMKLIFRNFEILAPCCDVIILKLGQIGSLFTQNMQIWGFLTQF